MPKLSIIVPVYNTSKYLKKCLDSVLNQSFKDFELICVDDGSTDNSFAILQEYSNYAKILQKPNGGLSSARNYALDRATGDYVLFVDSDDYLLPNSLERLMQRTIYADTVIGYPVIAYEGDRRTEEFDKRYFSPNLEGKVQVTEDILKSVPVVAWAKVFNRKRIEDNGIRFPDGLLYEDTYFFWAYFLSEKSVYFEPEPVYCYVRRPNSIMSKSGAQQEGYSINRVFIFDRILSFYDRMNSIRTHDRILSYLGEELYWGAFYDAPDFEKPRVIWEMAKVLRFYDFDTSGSKLLDAIKSGNIQISVPLSNTESLPKRHWIVSALSPYFPHGTKRREVASFIYQLLRKFYYSTKACKFLEKKKF